MATSSICSSSVSASMNAVSSSTTASSGLSSRTSMASSLGLEPGSGSVGASFTSNSRALTMMKHTFSGEIASETLGSSSSRRFMRRLRDHRRPEDAHRGAVEIVETGRHGATTGRRRGRRRRGTSADRESGSAVRSCRASAGLSAGAASTAGRLASAPRRSGRRSALAVTRIDEVDMAIAAISGVAWPGMAIGTAIRL